MEVEDMQRLERVEMVLIIMCQVDVCSYAAGQETSEDLRKRLRIVSVSAKVCQERLRWFRHV
jgi:hypothetical protein